MAGPVPTPKKLKQVRLDILRSIYYKQQLPKSVLLIGVQWVLAEQTSLLQRKLMVVEDGKYVLTELGLLALKEMAGGRVPPMIRMRREMFSDKKHTEKFIVGRSLAKEIFREISVDG